MLIKNLFDPSKNIYRTIEKVITYGAAQEERLRAEITEYVVTESMEEQFEELLGKMQLAMEQGGPNEVGVWVSGFYGSGKSSFTKYLGLALDESVTVDGVRFLRHLQDRMNRPQTRALLNTVSARFPAAVIFLDLASEMLAGATMEDVSTVLYYKVLQWAGYSRNLKVAALERQLQQDGRYQEFTERIAGELEVPWSQVQNDPLVIDSLLPEMAHQFYPQLFKTPTAFSTEADQFVRFENERVEEMIDIARQVSGKDYILFIIDEVGQYIGPRPTLILNIDGLAKNLKAIGDGKVWIVATAQQTLTEDDPRSSLNSPELYKLSARFPIQIDLESNDIREICVRRLLGKSPDGAKALAELFSRNGQALRHNTKLDARQYDADFDQGTFVDLYPFLPAHFGVLLHLLGQLAKSTGGLGLRSAIKIIQDILVEGTGRHPAAADQPVGWLATAVTLYDALERDIRRAFPAVHGATSKAISVFRDSSIHQEVAKTVAVLQILNNMPVTAQNIAGLLHPAVDATSRREQVDAAVEALAADPYVPFGEQDGELRFFSEKINDIDQERAQLHLRTIEIRRIFNEALRQLFNPLPSARLHGSLTISSGLKTASGTQVISLAGDRETVQMVVELADPAGYEAARGRLLEESRQRSSRNTIFLLGRHPEEADGKLAEIYRSQEIARLHRNDLDQEVKEYCVAQADRADRLNSELQHLLGRGLVQGSFIFRGQITAVESLDRDLQQAARKHLAGVAEQVFDRYGEAPLRAETALAERFLKAGSLRAVTAAIDPLGLVQVSGGAPSIQVQHKALVSIRDHVERSGTVEGRRLIDHFTDAPFGWSQDTLRYLVAAMLVAGEVRLKVSGREVTVNGQQAVEALRTNNAFKPVGVSLRYERPSMESLARAAQRLTDLVGDSIIPLEDEISRAATRHFPRFQHRYGPLAEKLAGLGLPGVATVRSLNQELADLLLADGSDTPQVLGAPESALYDNLKWAMAVDTALRNGLEAAVRDLQWHRREILSLPEAGIPGALRADLADDLELLGQRLAQEDFYQHAADLNTTCTRVKARVRDAAIQMAGAQDESRKQAAENLQRLPEWGELTREEQSQLMAQLEALEIQVTPDLQGLRRLLAQEYVFQSQVAALRRQVEALGHQRRLARQREARSQPIKEGPTQLQLPARLHNVAELDALIQRLEALRVQLDESAVIELSIASSSEY